jgi:hypothetical protein
MSGPENVRGQPFHVDRKVEGTSFMIWPEIISFLSTHLYSSISWFNGICFGSMLKITLIQIFCQKKWGWGDIDCSPKFKKSRGTFPMFLRHMWSRNSHSSGHLSSHPVFSGVCVDFCVVFCRSLFVLILLAIVLSILLRFKDSDYLFGIFDLRILIIPLESSI